jgi:hypothetical protein
MEKTVKIIGASLWAVVLIAGVYFYSGDYFIKKEKVNPVITRSNKNNIQTKPRTGLTPSDKPTSGKYKVFLDMADLKEATKAVRDFAKLFFNENPNSKNLITHFDISGNDGHLVVNVKDAVFIINKSQQEEVYNSITRLWNGTKYVREKSYGNWIEVKYFDDQKLVETILFDSQHSSNSLVDEADDSLENEDDSLEEQPEKKN